MDHLPSFYEEIKEFRELTGTGSIQLEQLSAAIDQFLDDQYVLTSSEPAVARREKVFRIVPDLKKESLDFRKKRVLSRMQNKPPFVLEYLSILLDSLLGENSHTFDLDVVNYHLEALLKMEHIMLTADSGLYKEISDLLEKIVPLNMNIGITAQRNLDMNQYVGGILSEWKTVELKPIEFSMPNLQESQYVTGYVSTWNRMTINPEVKHKWLITRVLS